MYICCTEPHFERDMQADTDRSQAAAHLPLI